MAVQMRLAGTASCRGKTKKVHVHADGSYTAAQIDASEALLAWARHLPSCMHDQHAAVDQKDGGAPQQQDVLPHLSQRVRSCCISVCIKVAGQPSHWLQLGQGLAVGQHLLIPPHHRLAALEPAGTQTGTSCSQATRAGSRLYAARPSRPQLCCTAAWEVARVAETARTRVCSTAASTKPQWGQL